jgi:hypothetical protein
MASTIRIWSVEGESLAEVPRRGVDFESRLEDWMDSDVSVLSDDLLVIARQIDTDGGGTLDLLCLDRSGDLVVVELKREKTPRDVVAQVLDYAAWAAALSYERIVELGDQVFADGGGLEAAFLKRFDSPLPEVLNADHHLLVVSSEVDPRSERIIRYLSETHGVSINAVTFNYFRTPDDREFLARTHLIEPDAVEERTARKSGSIRRRRPVLEYHREEAERRGIGDLYERLVEGLSRWRRPDPMKSMISFYFRDGEGWTAVFNVVTTESGQNEGLRFNAYKHRLGRAFGLSPDQIRALLPTDAKPWEYSTDASAPENDWEGYSGAFRSIDEIDHFLAELDRAPRQPTH